MPERKEKARAHPPVVPAEAARLLLMNGAGLLADPDRRATPEAIHRQIQRMGFVQIDTINVVARAHHHVLHSRFDNYQPPALARLLEGDRKLFEHWTHDASVIPTAWLTQWKVRFRHYENRGHSPNSWWAQRMGDKGDRVVTHVLDRITGEGPLMSRDFEHPENNGPWWGWKPQKAALEYLWRIGKLAVARRVNFHKVYDLIERVFPALGDLETPSDEDYIDWACREAMQRLVVATPAELAEFFGAISLPDARNWCRQAVDTGDIIEVKAESANGSSPRAAYAMRDWRKRVDRCAAPPPRMRLLSPFDPVVRDRKRALRLFNFDYRFEGFVPEKKRKWGYYVFPILQGDRFVGRLDPKLHRDRGELEIRNLWWEPKAKPSKKARTELCRAVQRLALFLEADRIVMPSKDRRGI